MMPVPIPTSLPDRLPAIHPDGAPAAGTTITIDVIGTAIDADLLTVQLDATTAVYEMDVDELGVAPGHHACTSMDWTDYDLTSNEISNWGTTYYDPPDVTWEYFDHRFTVHADAGALSVTTSNTDTFHITP